MVLLAFISAILIIDLLVLNRKGVVINNKKAAFATGLWILVAGPFSLTIHWLFKADLVDNPTYLTANDAFMKYIARFLIELSLSVDNLSVIAMLFASFKIPIKNQHRVLFYGILGAIVFRDILIWPGVILINKISWMTYIFGAFLLLKNRRSKYLKTPYFNS
ncbi:TerC family protein [Eudoraea sp.]|uniref:TerC family protein n=1 Tax=Eudoraea sp. TaxID=1979955 RepID=UPI003C726B5A